jgi:RNA polymerase sigma-70 factor, ECF subfamily
MIYSTEQAEKRPLTWQELKQADDNVLMAEVVAGNDDAFAFIVERYQRLIYSVALRYVEDREEAQDVVQIALADAYRAKQLFDPSKGTLKMWLLQYAYTRAINRHYHLKRRLYSNLSLDEIKPLAYATGRAIERELTRFEKSRYVSQVLNLLKPKQKQTIELIALEGLTLQEAADKLGDTLPKTRHNYYRGISKLQKILSPQGQEARKQAILADIKSCPSSRSRWEVDDYIRVRAERTTCGSSKQAGL